MPLVAFICGIALLVSACGGSGDESAPRTPQPAPEVVLTAEEKQVWAPLPPDRSSVPVLLYHGIGAGERLLERRRTRPTGSTFDDFAKQMTMIKHAGYQTIDLPTFLRFVQGEPVDLPPRPLLLTFDDARADSWTGSDGILEKLGFNAVMFVDVGRVDDGRPRIPDLAGARDGPVERALAAPAPLRPRAPADPVRPRPERLRPVLRLRAAGRDVRRMAGAACAPTSTGARTRSPTRFPLTNRSPSPPRTATTGRTAPTTRASRTTCSAG